MIAADLGVVRGRRIFVIDSYGIEISMESGVGREAMITQLKAFNVSLVVSTKNMVIDVNDL